MHKPKDFELRLAEIRVRLGDLKRFEGDTAAAMEEYRGALSIRETCCAPHDRALSDVHFSLAVAFIYLASEEQQDILACKRAALAHYGQSRDVLKLWIEEYKKNPTSLMPSTINDLYSVEYTPGFIEQLIGDLTETIDALKQEITNPESTSMSGSSTTIGFGSASALTSTAPSSTSAISSSFPASSRIDNIFGATANGLAATASKREFSFNMKSTPSNTEAKKRDAQTSSEDTKENTLTKDAPALSFDGASAGMQIKKKLKSESTLADKADVV